MDCTFTKIADDKMTTEFWQNKTTIEFLDNSINLKYNNQQMIFQLKNEELHPYEKDSTKQNLKRIPVVNGKSNHFYEFISIQVIVNAIFMNLFQVKLQCQVDLLII